MTATSSCLCGYGYDPYTEADDELMAREPQAEAFEDDAAYRAVWRAWADEADKFEGLKTAGAVIVWENGCGFSNAQAAVDKRGYVFLGTATAASAAIWLRR
ncbi:hypothetical protein ACWGI9_20440 [Streptomyces sp. NPDC054833]